MKNKKSSRRSFLSQTCQLSPFFLVPGLMAEQLTITPMQTPGPFYPDKLPLDTDNDLVLINDSLTPSVGTIAYLGGKVTAAKLGYKNVKHLSAGISGWKRSGAEVAKK